MVFGTRKTEHKTLKHKIPINKTIVDRRNRKPQKNNLKQVSHKKVNLEKAHAIAVESLETFLHNVLNQHLLQKINGHSKQQHKIYVMSHRSLNINVETKNTIN